MLSQRVSAAALRRGTSFRMIPWTFSGTRHNLARATLASNTSLTHFRPLTTEKLSPNEGHTILERQRLQRPVSPHLTIYDKKQTWFSGSIWQRFTGGAMSGALYLYATAYLVAPLAGWHLESQSLVAAFAALPVAAKLGAKFVLAFPFTYHFFNGVRHIVFDFALGYQKKNIIKTGYFIWGASILSAVGLLLV